MEKHGGLSEWVGICPPGEAYGSFGAAVAQGQIGGPVVLRGIGQCLP